MTDILFMLKMISSAVTEKNSPMAPTGVNWEKILKISSKHNITNIIAYAIINGDYNIPDNIRSLFVKNMYLRVAVSENQKAEIQSITDAFKTEDIDFMPFKGLFISNLYPSIDMRYMSDADILIRNDQVEKADLVMKELGYEFEVEGPIEYNYIKRPYMHVELHHCIISPSNEDLYDYYKDSWKFAQKTEEKSRYELNLEDHFIFIFSHFVRHYRDAGAGIKAIIDIWLYMKKYTEMDWKYITGELEKLNLKPFFDNLCRLVKFWFEDGEQDELLVSMTEFIVSSGTFGTRLNSLSAKSIRESKGKLEGSKQKQLLRMFFPNSSYMKNAFPVLKKHPSLIPFLLPFLWPWRLIRGAIFKEKRKRIKAHTDVVKYTDDDKVKEYAQHMKMVGLDMYNGRKKNK